MRCPDCNKFTSMETEPEDVQLELNTDTDGAAINGSVTVNRNCADCGTTLKALTMDVDHPISDDELSASAEGLTRENVKWETGQLEDESPSAEGYESGGGRYQKNMVGAELTAVVVFKLKKKLKCENVMVDEVSVEVPLQIVEQASAYEEQV